MSEYVDADGVTHESYQDYVATLVGLCGCRDDAIVGDLVAILGAYLGSEYIFYTDLPVTGPEKYRELLLHVLDNAGLLEHGSSIRGSWLTDKGKDIARRLQEEGAQP